MRRARLKPEGIPLFYHVYNRVAGEPGYFPFGPAEKERFIRLLHKLNTFYTVKVVAYQIMSNHFHLVVHAPDEPPEPDEVCRRYQEYYGGRRTLEPSDPDCEILAYRMRDISWYMHDLQQQFSVWFNRTRPTRRRGTLWADRFKHTLLGDSQAVWECIKYLEMNPVRAGMVADPADYRFCSFGTWSATGRHPFAANVQAVLLPWLEGIHPFGSLQQLREAFRESFAGIAGKCADTDGNVARFVIQVDRRVRYWVDGLVIGSELFVQDMISRCDPHLRPRRKGLVRAHGPGRSLWCYKQLRSL